jgi:hypothetical protein
MTDPRCPAALNRAVRAALKMTAPDIALGLETAENGAQGLPEPQAGSTVVQIGAASPTGRTEPLEIAPEPPTEPDPVNVQPAIEPPAVMAPPDPEDDGLVTPAQLRKLNALLGELDRAEGRRLSRDERRTLIGSLAGVEGLDSAKDLTRTEASTAIDAVAGMVATILDAEQADHAAVVEEVPGE